MKVKIYTSPVCTYCHILKIFLKKNNISFEEIDILEKKQEAEKIFEQTGKKTLPITFIDNNLVVGYDTKRIKELLNIK